MVEQILFFVLGFLAASLAALAFLRAVWSRAVRLTTTRVVSRLPVSPAMIAADRDRMRAAHAIEIRRLERRVEHLSSTGLGPETISTQDKAAIRRLSGELAEARSRLGTVEQQRTADVAATARPASSPLGETILAASRRAVTMLRSGIGQLPIGREVAGDANYPAKVAALESEVHSLLGIVDSLETELAGRHAAPDRPLQAGAEEDGAAADAPAPAGRTSDGAADVAGTDALVAALAEQAETLERRLALERQASESHRQDAERLAAERESIAAELASTLEMLRAERAGSAVDVDQMRADRARLQARVADLEEARHVAGQAASDAVAIAAAAEERRLRDRVGALETEIGRMAGTSDTLRRDRAEAIRSAEIVLADRDRMGERIVALEAATRRSDADLDALRTERSDIGRQADAARTELALLRRRSGELERAASESAASLETRHAERSGLLADLEAGRTERGNLASELAALHAERKALLGRVAELERASADAAAAHGSAAAEQVDNVFLRDQLAALADQIARLAADPDADAVPLLQAREPERAAIAAGQRR